MGALQFRGRSRTQRSAASSLASVFTGHGESVATQLKRVRNTCTTSKRTTSRTGLLWDRVPAFACHKSKKTDFRAGSIYQGVGLGSAASSLPG
jgi:hypothetical protein